jgi:hypothetical protein
MAGRDMAEVIFNYLKTHADAATLRGYVQGGDANILEAGDLTEEIVAQAIADRRTAGDYSKALAIAVQDAGEEELDRFTKAQNVNVRIYDRDRGYRNLRTCKLELVSLLGGDFDEEMTAGIGVAHMATFFVGRAGHRWDRIYDVEYEVLRFRNIVQYARG